LNKQFSAEFFREYCLTRLADFSWEPRLGLSGLVPASVLVALIPEEQGMQVLLTRRTEHLHHHAGQISFPGGRREQTDGSAIATALRETQEEVGIDPRKIEVLGTLPDFPTPSGFCITPIIGLLPKEIQTNPDSFEVAEVFKVPLSFLTNFNNYQCHRINRQGAPTRYVYAIPYRGRFVWGATAGILRMLMCFLDGTK
jgi:8-oxo-dGTP pyrophosphatase MutT (NUDIX family)